MKEYSYFQKWKAKYLSKCFIRYEKRHRWIGQLPVYLAHCKKHGYYESHPQGYSKVLVCLECLLDKSALGTSKNNIKEKTWETRLHLEDEIKESLC